MINMSENTEKNEKNKKKNKMTEKEREEKRAIEIKKGLFLGLVAELPSVYIIEFVLESIMHIGTKLSILIQGIYLVVRCIVLWKIFKPKELWPENYYDD